MTPRTTPPESLAAGRYIVGRPASRFAVMLYGGTQWRFPWQRPRGGWWLGHLIFWWAR